VYRPRCPVDLEHGYIYSDNIISARVAVGLGAYAWLNYAQRFGLSDSAHARPLPLDFPTQASQINFQGARDAANELAEDAFGQGTVKVSPLEMAFFSPFSLSEVVEVFWPGFMVVFVWL
jgi:cell division protein FtsI/penicillin-binding protein 2